MNLITKQNCLILLFILLSVISVSAKNGDKINIVSHDKEFVITDPSKGFKTYTNWTQFPDDSIQYRKIILNITYACPDSLHCGQWDYIDAIYLRRAGSQDSDSLNYELARTISPYGWYFDSTWSFSWYVDVTDFGFVLHDSVEIEFYHSGYEANDDRGWLITLDFEITEGRPAMECIGIDTLWSGKFPYGDSSKPIEELLYPIEFSHDSADIARLRIHQTGHGMDDSANCAEFCSKYRQVYFDDSLFNQRQIWRKCTDNPLYPQAGTWIFNRANWCPGSVVFPDLYDFEITKSKKHTVNIDMEPYINPNKPSANYWIYSYLFYYKKPWATNDVSLEEIIVPSSKDVYSRINPACANPEILIKNNGAETLKELVIKYGMLGEFNILKWNGNLLPQQYKQVSLPTFLNTTQELDTFFVSLQKPNNQDDEFRFDNKLQAEFVNPPTLPLTIILSYKANKEPHHNEFALSKLGGGVEFNFNHGSRITVSEIFHERELGSLVADSIYRDTIYLESGCYQFNYVDTSGDGLALWFNPDGGYGYVRILDMNEQLIKNFNSDFGSDLKFAFQVTDDNAEVEIVQDPILQIFPPRNKGQFEVDLFFNNKTDFRLEINSDSLGLVYEKNYQAVKELYFPIDISSQPDGTYNLNVITDDTTITRRVRIKH